VNDKRSLFAAYLFSASRTAPPPCFHTHAHTHMRKHTQIWGRSVYFSDLPMSRTHKCHVLVRVVGCVCTRCVQFCLS